MKTTHNIPFFVSAVVVLLGFNDLLRGVMHTIFLKYSATSIAGLDLATNQSGDLLMLLNAFGISNYLTGIMLLMLACTSRLCSLVMLGLIPLIYILFFESLQPLLNLYQPPQSPFLGKYYMLFYLSISGLTFMIGLILTLYNKKHRKNAYNI